MTTIFERHGIEYDSEGPVCPITGYAFQDPVFCIEDGGVYERAAIKAWFATSMDNYRIGIRIAAYPAVKSPLTGIALKTLTLVPERRYEGRYDGWVQVHAPEVLKADASFEAKNSSCVRDETIRSLLLRISQARVRAQENPEAFNSEFKLLQQLAKEFTKRRTELGLGSCDPHLSWSPDLSNLDLSGMRIEGIEFKHRCIANANLSNTHWINCSLDRVGLFGCDLRNARFEHCLFRGEETAFHGSDVSGAEFTPDSGLDCSEGNWKRIETWEGFVEELTRRGALHADRAYAFGCKPPPPRPAQVAPPPPKGLWNRLLQLFGRS